MLGLEMLVKLLGIEPEHIQQTFQLFNTVASEVQEMRSQLHRIEQNTLLILEGIDGTAPAGPTRYDLLPVMDKLPPMNGERHAE